MEIVYFLFSAMIANINYFCGSSLLHSVERARFKYIAAIFVRLSFEGYDSLITRLSTSCSRATPTESNAVQSVFFFSNICKKTE